MSVTFKLPLVSTVITNHNYANFIEDALNSVKEQTYRPLECIIVDDASTDNSVPIIERFIEENQKESSIHFKLIKLEKNIGQLGGFILGIREQKGIFINFLDSDDVLFPDFVSTHVQVLLEVNVGMSVSRQVIVDDDNSLISATDDDFWCKSNKNIYQVSEILSFNDFSVKCDKKVFDERDSSLFEIIEDPPFGHWAWASTSNIMFRKASLTVFNFEKLNDAWKICADRLFLNLVHFNFGSCRIHRRLIGYRRHTSNNYTKKISFGQNNYCPACMKEKDGDKNTFGISILKFLKESVNDQISLDLFEHCYLSVISGLSCTEILKHPLLISQFLLHTSKPHCTRLIRNWLFICFLFFTNRYKMVRDFNKQVNLL